MKTITFEGVDHEFPDEFTQPQISYALSLDKLKRHMTDTQSQGLSQGVKNSIDASSVALDSQTRKGFTKAQTGTPLTTAMFPRTAQVDATGKGSAPLAYLHDVASIPGRALASLPEARRGGIEGLMHGMTDINGNSITGGILRSPSTAFMAGTAPLTGGMSLLAGSALAGGVGAVDNQVNNYSQGQKVDPAQALQDAAMYTAGGYGLGKVAQAAGPLVKKGLSYLGDKALQSFEAPALKTILSKLGYDPSIVQNALPFEAKIGDVAGAANRVAKEMKSVDILHLPEKAYIKTQEGLKKYGNAIGDVGDMASKNGVQANIGSAINDFYKDFHTGLAEKGIGVSNLDAMDAQFMPKVDAMVKSLGADAYGNVPLDKGMAFKVALQEMVNNYDKSANLPFMQDAAKKLSNNVIEIIRTSDPTYGPKIIELYKPFSTLKKYEPMINSAYESATGASARGENGLSVPLLTKHSAVKSGLNIALNPKRWATGLSDRLTEAAANFKQLDQIAPGIDFTKTIPRTSTMEMAQTMNRDKFGGSRPNDGEIGSRGPVEPRPPFTPAPPTYVPRQGSTQSPFGTPTQESPAQFDPLEAMNPRNRSQAPQVGQGSIEDLAPPEMAQARQQAGQDAAEAYIRQDRPARISQPTPPAQQPTFRIVTPTEAALKPRQPVGDIPSNFPQPYIENPKVAQVLDEAQGRRGLTGETDKIKALKVELKNATTKESKQKILAKLRDENYRIPLGDLPTESSIPNMDKIKKLKDMLATAKTKADKQDLMRQLRSENYKIPLGNQ